LSAAPNGKNHRETQSCESKTLVERYPVRGLDPRITRGPPLGRQSSLPAEPGGTSCRQSRQAHLSMRRQHRLRRRRHSSGSPTPRPRGPDDGKIPPRSHNSLIHICPSTSRPPASRSGSAGGNLCFMPRIRLRCSLRLSVRLSPKAALSPVGAAQLRRGATAVGREWR